MSTFHTQTAVPLDSPAYVEREFERIIVQYVFKSKWVLLLGPHQHGKTTGLYRVNKHLKDSGCLSAFIDLQGLVNVCETYEELLKIFCEKVAKRINVPFQEQHVNVKQLIDWLEKTIPPGKQPVVIIVDEASAITNDDWRNTFYSQIRAIKNEQAGADSDSLVSRLRFIFSGCFRPEDLVQTVNSPFNACDEISTDDLFMDQIEQLYKQVTEKTDIELIKSTYEIVGGNPYLLQTIFDRVYLAPEAEKELSLSKAIAYLYSGQDNHVPFLFKRIHDDEKLKKLVVDMIKNSRIANDPADANSKFLRTLGLAKLEGTNLVFRNKLYEDLAGNSPLFKQVEHHEGVGSYVTTILGGVGEMKNINIYANKSKIDGNLVVSETIKNSFNKIQEAEVADDMKQLLVSLGNAVDEMAKILPTVEGEDAVEDFKRLADEAVKKSPKEKWYSVSIEGLQKAAAKLGEVGKPVLELTGQLLLLLTQMNK